ncbi:nitroreductase family protein [Candidatus Poriferisodalis sp.]|uniref:nitroreductase family protein n=1 Tax=Candidatus Poriferisodalis sp. TaxID=3101277 RepID=UPI003B01151D
MPTPQLNPHVPARYDIAGVDLASVDGVLSTTRSVRLRLDLERDVPHDLVLDCIDLAEQGPGGGNQASRRWLLVRDPQQRQAIGDLYHSVVGEFMQRSRDATAGTGHAMEQVMKSAAHLAEHLAEVPVHVIPCVWGVHDDSGKPGLFDSVLQSAWSFCLAARSRGLATAWTTAILSKDDELRDVLGIPAGVTPVALLPLAWSKGSEFGAVPRRRANEIAYVDGWGRTWEARGGDSTARSLSEGPGATVEIDIDAAAERVWEIVSDINAGAAFSEEFVRAEWAPGFDGPALGATFIGHNQHPAVGEWNLELTVTEYEPNVLFGWASGETPEQAGARWRYEIDVLHGQRCRLRHAMRIGPGPSGLTMAITATPDKEPRILARRQSEHLANMTRCVEGIKALAESGT